VVILTKEQRIRWIAKPLVFVLCLTPLTWLGWQAFAGGLGANPIEAVNRFLGDWALRFLLISLAVTPLRAILGLPVLIRFRRMLGLFAFFYVTLHLSSYVGLDQFFAWGEIWADIVKRNYITVGMIAFALLVPLALTSTKSMIKRLGGRRWKKLHMLVYPAAILGVFHFLMMVKADIREPLIYAAVLAVLLGYRAVAWVRPRTPRRVRRASKPSGAIRV
jgi:sulfoxide reductase heme-binding subunit YedZ